MADRADGVAEPTLGQVRLVVLARLVRFHRLHRGPQPSRERCREIRVAQMRGHHLLQLRHDLVLRERGSECLARPADPEDAQNLAHGLPGDPGVDPEPRRHRFREIWDESPEKVKETFCSPPVPVALVPGLTGLVVVVSHVALLF